MKRKRFAKRAAGLILACILPLSLVACGDKGSVESTSGSSENPGGSFQEDSQKTPFEGEAGDQKDLSWLNPSSTLPLVKEGTEKTLHIYIQMAPDSPDPEEVWMYRFIENAMNINLEVTKFTGENRNEIVPLAFVGDELPDIIIGGGFTAEELVNYGVTEGQLVDLTPYLNETYMPNLAAIYAEHPEYKSTVQDGEGHVWSTGYITDPQDCQNISRAFMNYDWLEDCDREIPTTLDELLDVLRAFKERDKNCYPLGGGTQSLSPMVYILNAFGYLTSDPSGMSIALRDGQVVLPVADREAYGAFLEFVNTLYLEGLIHPDFFTMDHNTICALITEGRNGFVAQAPFVFGVDYQEWWGVQPLTSQYNDTAQWPANLGALSCGSAVVTTACEEPELAATFLDWFYTFHHLRMSTVGPGCEFDPEYLYGLGGWYLDEKLDTIHNYPEGYSLENIGDYIAQKVQLWGYGCLGIDIYDGSEGEINPLLGWMPDDYAAQLEDTSVLRHDETYSYTGQNHYMMAQKYTLGYHVTSDVFPAQIYFDADTASAVNKLKVLLNDYAEKESAKFITGARPLNELDDYFDEIERLGAREYVQYYEDYYKAIQ